MAFLNIEAKLRETIIDGAPLMSFVRGVRHVAVDRVFLLFDAAAESANATVERVRGRSGPRGAEGIPEPACASRTAGSTRGSRTATSSCRSRPRRATARRRSIRCARALRRRRHRPRPRPRAREGVAREQRVPAGPQDESGPGVRAALRAGHSPEVHARSRAGDDASCTAPAGRWRRSPAATRSTPPGHASTPAKGRRSCRRDRPEAKEEPIVEPGPGNHAHSDQFARVESQTCRTVATGRKVRRRESARSAARVSDRRSPVSLRRSSSSPRNRHAARAVAGQGLDLSVDRRRRDRRRSSPFVIRRARSRFTCRSQSTSRGMRGPSEVRFQIAVRRRATRGLIGRCRQGDRHQRGESRRRQSRSPARGPPGRGSRTSGLEEARTRGRLAEGLEGHAGRASTPGGPARFHRIVRSSSFTERSRTPRPPIGDLATSDFFDRLKDTYGDRIFAFDHFSVSRTPEENARMLLEALPEQTTTFDVVTHSRGGLVLRHLVERGDLFGQLSRRFKLGRAVLVASPNDGTPLATPKRWDETVGWLANLLELFPDNPFTTGAAFVANGLVWLANHVSGDLPGSACDGSVEASRSRRFNDRPGRRPTPIPRSSPTTSRPARCCSVCWMSASTSSSRPPTTSSCRPKAAGASIARPPRSFRPVASDASGPGGNLDGDSVTHVNFFRAEGHRGLSRQRASRTASSR